MVVHEWVRKKGFQFGCLIETGVKENKVKKIMEKVFPDWSYITNHESNRLGRLWIVWSPRVRVTPVFQSAQLVTCSVLLEGLKEEFFCSFFYVYNLAEERKEMWRDLKVHQDSPILKNSPWIIQGGFNDILNGVEHSVIGSSQDHSGMRKFEEAVQYCSLIDMSAFHLE